MSAPSPPVQPPPDPRALLAVLEAERRSESASRAELASAALEVARVLDVGDLQVRRAANAYSDAVDGFTRPTASTGYVFAALYAMRRRVGQWIGIPFLFLSLFAAGMWCYGAFERAQRLENLRVSAQTRLKAARQKFEESASVYSELDRRVRAELPVPPNQAAVRKMLVDLEDRKTSLGKQLDAAESRMARDESTVRLLRHESDRILPDIEEFELDLNRAREMFLKGRELARIRGRLEAILAEAQSLPPPSPLAEARAIYDRGIAALERSAVETAAEIDAELGAWVRAEREAAGIPDQLAGLLAQVKQLTTDSEVLSRAAAFHRQGRWAFDLSDRLQAKESIYILKELVADLSEEYTLIMTGGKWRYKNSDPSVRIYYVIVEAVDPNGVRLEKHIRNEEDGTGATVRQWGERVPFSVYEQVRKDKKDNGRIVQDVFGRKSRGRLEVQVELRTDDGEILPRVGQITRW
jgi:hypothetical protein